MGIYNWHNMVYILKKKKKKEKKEKKRIWCILLAYFEIYKIKNRKEKNA